MDNKTQKVFDFIKANPNANKETITTGTGFSGLRLFNLLRKLQTERLIESSGEGDDALYILCQQQTDKDDQDATEKTEEVANEVPAENITAVEEVKAEDQQPVAEQKRKPIGRNNTQYVFNEKVYGKGPLVHAVVAKYVEDHPETTFEQLKEIFPDALMKRFGVFALETEARLISGKVNRYFLKPEQLIKLKDSEEEAIAVCNQWTSALLEPFLEIAKNLGYEITEKQD